jgi:hypothetical protein
MSAMQWRTPVPRLWDTRELHDHIARINTVGRSAMVSLCSGEEGERRVVATAQLSSVPEEPADEPAHTGTRLSSK